MSRSTGSGANEPPSTSISQPFVAVPWALHTGAGRVAGVSGFSADSTAGVGPVSVFEHASASVAQATKP